MAMTQDTEDVVASLRKRAAWQRENLGDMLDCGTAWPELERGADLIQSLSDRIDVLEGARIETCDHGHKYVYLPDHPRRDGLTRCPHCLAIGLDAARAALHQEATAP